MELLNPLTRYRALQIFYAKTQYRTSVRLAPTIDPRVFIVPEFFQHDPAAVTIEVFHNGRRLIYSNTQTPTDGEFFATESNPGLGYDRVHLVSFSANSRSVLTANYFSVT